jgi:ABC-type oligopeptide transport system substrate-binding subunit
VLLSESTARLVRGSFELANLGKIGVKGKTAPVAVFEVVRPFAAPARERGLAVLHSPLVGRDAELATLTGVLAGLCEGHGGIVALLGEAGLGKSRLLEEAHAWAGANLCQPPRWLEGRAVSYGGGLSYWTVTQLLKADLGLSDGDPEVRARVVLRRRLTALLGAQAADVSPYLAHLLGLKLEGEEAERLAALDSETVKYQLLVCLRRYFGALAERQPLVLVCEDLHWADPSTLDALGELLALTDHVPVLLLLVGRVERGHGSWRLKLRAETEYAHRYAEIVLRPLAESDSARLVDNLLSEGRGEVTSPLRRLLLDRAEGNPFYLEELVASLVEQGVLARGGEGDAWQVKASIESLSIPDTVQGLLLARIDRLEEDVRGTLQMASVIGRSFLYRLLQAIACRGEAFQPEPATAGVGPSDARLLVTADLPGNASPILDRHLVILQRADLVREKAVHPELEYIFKHSLAQEAAYHSLLLERRREYHRRAGEALERLFADRREEFYGLLAHHFDLAEQVGDPAGSRGRERAVHYLIAAGDKARLEDALPEAARFYRRAVERLEAAGDAEGASAEAASRAWLKLALVHQVDFDFAAAHDAYECGFALGQRASRRTRRSPDANAGVRLGGSYSVASLDPGKQVWSAEAKMTEQLFAGLAEVDAELNVVPHAARSWEVLEDGLCYRIHLRPDVCWTDGSPVTAHDYAYAWLRNLNPQVITDEYPACILDGVVGARAYRLGRLQDPERVGARALDDSTLEVRLEKPLAYFPYLLALPITFPLSRRVVERWGEAWWQPENILSNGPFRLLHFEPEHIVLEHNPLYFGESSGNLTRAEYLAIPDENERLRLFRSGSLDWAGQMPEMPDDMATFLQHAPSLFASYLVLAPQPPLADLRVRRAIAMAIDRQSLARRWGMRPATGGIVPPGVAGYTPGLALPYDREQARRLLAEAGYPEGQAFPQLRSRSPLLGWIGKISASLVQTLAEVLPVGIDLERGEPSDLPDLAGGAHLFFCGWVADLPDPDDFLRRAEPYRALHKAGWRDPELDGWLERAAHTPDRTVRMALYRQADRRLVSEQTLVVPLAYGGWNELCQPWVHGLAPNKMGNLNLKDVVVEKHASA